MEERISATELARRLGDFLGRVRYRGDSFVVEKNGTAVARLSPVSEGLHCTLGEALKAWSSVGERDPSFADDLEIVGELDQPPDDPWAS